MTPSRPVPEWAADLIATVCDDHGRRPPKVSWWSRDEWYSSGHCYKSEGRIHVTAGTSDIDTRITLLHELAHWLGRPNWSHNRRFWELAWELFIRHADADLDWALVRSAAYKTKALTYCPLVDA